LELALYLISSFGFEGVRSSFTIASSHAILVLNRPTRGRSTRCGRIYEGRFSMSCPPAST
jgi:hypothetical protein